VEVDDLKLTVERSEAADCLLCLGTASLEVDADISDRALLNEASLLDVADEADLASSVEPSPLVLVLETRGLVTVTTDGACKDFTDGADDDIVREGVERPAACEPLAGSAFLLAVLRAMPDRVLFDKVETVAEEAVLDTDLTELADEVSRLRTEGVAVAGLVTPFRRILGRIELAMLEASSSMPLRILCVVCLMGAGALVAGGAVLNRSSTGTSISKYTGQHPK
jgi:hypothetical protein